MRWNNFCEDLRNWTLEYSQIFSNAIHHLTEWLERFQLFEHHLFVKLNCLFNHSFSHLINTYWLCSVSGTGTYILDEETNDEKVLQKSKLKWERRNDLKKMHQVMWSRVTWRRYFDSQVWLLEGDPSARKDKIGILSH